ncbi:MAG: response regulator, partial [Acidobacteria bacterium]|nr:response regulator [Acidobacteriota bacterium]
TVTIDLKRDDEGLAVLNVRDTGIGIDQEFLPNIFDRFSQADASTRRSFTGLGLGLTIVRTIVELHGGSIAVDSGGVGKGSTFTARLPLHEELELPRVSDASSVVKKNGGDPMLDGVKILLVDDDAENLIPLQIGLESANAEVDTASSAAEALSLLQNENFDVVISDVGMPGEDGYQLIEKIRQIERKTQTSLPAIALTAYASSEDRERALSAGFESHLPKPHNFEDVVSEIERLLGRRK